MPLDEWDVCSVGEWFFAMAALLKLLATWCWYG